MLVPDGLYGINREAQAFCRKMTMRLKHGETWEQTFGSVEITDTASRAGLLLVSGPAPVSAAVAGYHFYLPLKATEKLFLGGQLPPARQSEIFAACCQSAWGTLSLACNDNLMWLYDRQRHTPFLKAAQRFWPEIQAAGERYSMGSSQGVDLWRLPNGVRYVLANSGIEVETLQNPLPAEGIQALVRLINQNG